MGFRACIGLDRRAPHQRRAGQQALGQRHGVSGILVAQRRRKGRAREIARRHPPGVSDHLRTGGDAGFDRLQHQLHVEAGLLGDREALGDAGDLDRAHQIVDQLVDGAAADRAEMPDRGGERHEKRPRAFEVRGLGADQQGQFPARGSIGQAGDRTIDIDQPAATQFAGEIERMSDRTRSNIRSRARRLLWPKPHRPCRATRCATPRHRRPWSRWHRRHRPRPQADEAHRAPRAIRSSAFALLRLKTATSKPASR